MIYLRDGKIDLSENAEYHAAKRERGKNESRIRFLRNMIKTAIIIKDTSDENSVGLFDTVTYYVEEDDCEEEVKIVTMLRRDPFKRIISKESPLGSALMGKKVGDVVEFGGLLGSGPVMPLKKQSSEAFIARGGRIPAPLQSLKN